MAQTLDIRMNDFTPATDGKYIYAEDASGNQVKIDKNSFFLYLLKNNGIVDYNDSASIDNLTEMGTYSHWGPILPGGSYGMLVVLYSPGPYCVQVDFSFGGSIFIRTSVNKEWSSWKSISFT